MATQHSLVEASGSLDSIWRGPTANTLLLMFAAILGIVMGLAWALSPQLRAYLGEEIDYPLRLALPDAVVAAPAIDVLRTEEAAGVGAVSSSSDPQPGDNSSEARVASSAAALDTAVTAPETRPGGILALDYDLKQFAAANSGYDRSDGSIETSLPLLVDGNARGTAQIRVEDNAQILIATSSVASAIGERRAELPQRLSKALESGTGYLPFHELRAAGINVQYDPVNNRIALTLPS